MTKETARNRIIEHAGRIIRHKGFNNTGIKEILESAGVPKGSFYFHFRSKEDLGLALIDHYAEGLKSLSGSLFGNTPDDPLVRLLQFFDGMRMLFEQEEWRCGCPIGNLTQEMGTINEAFRLRLKNVLDMMQSGVRECLLQAMEVQQLDTRFDPDELGHFILDSWEGALLRMKAEGNTGPLIRFQRMISLMLCGR